MCSYFQTTNFNLLDLFCSSFAVWAILYGACTDNLLQIKKSPIYFRFYTYNLNLLEYKLEFSERKKREEKKIRRVETRGHK